MTPLDESLGTKLRIGG